MALLSSGNNLMFIAAPKYIKTRNKAIKLHANYRLPKRNNEQGNALANEIRK